MTIFDGLLLGILQGITEFIPVSSSGHLVLAQHFMGIKASPEFDALVNLGTFLALLVFFRKRIIDIIMGIVRNRDYRLARNIIITAVPVGIAGFFFAKFFEQDSIQNAGVVVITLALVGLIMVVIDKLPHLTVVESEEKMSPKRAFIIGIGQMFALIPGVSRSGSSIIAGRLVGLDYFKAAEYSFLASIPVMAGVILKGFMSHDGRQFIHDNLGVYIVSNLAAFIFGLVAVGFMISYLKKGNFKIFGYYRIGLAVVAGLVLVFAH
jgi:undecaprenyl-diphosphatase